MKLTALLLLSLSSATAIIMASPGTAAALTRTVDPSAATCDPNDTVAPCYRTIAAAINAAQSGETVLVKPGTYTERITLKSGIVLSGTETARTILTGGGSGTIITANTVTTLATISNFTFLSAVTGIDVSGNSAVKITNNVFWLGTGSGRRAVAITNSNSTATSVINNTFYQNATAVSRGLSETIANNIFANNSLSINTTDATGHSFNCYHANSSNGITLGSDDVSGDPLFVNPASSDQRDLHLKAGSPCINKGSNVQGGADSTDGTQNDMGAYGGSASDIIPRQVFDLSITGSTGSSITLSWSPNNSYLITTDNAATPANPRGYRVYYGNSSGTYTGTDAVEGASPIKINLQAGATAPPYTLSGLTPITAPPAVPTLHSVSPYNERLELKWSDVSGATGYNVYYGTSSPPTTLIDVGNKTSHIISGLVNGTTYYVAVSAYAQATYYIAVTAYDNTNQTLTPGESHESAYSQEVTAQIGNIAESGNSNVLSEIPDFITPYPNLPNTGCFIATAAYGQYSAPEVQVLRDFRDQYLLTNGLGRVFVRFYYRNGPTAARFINEQPWLKPVVRAALLPAVGGAYVMTRTSTTMKASIIFLVITSGIMLIRRKTRKA